MARSSSQVTYRRIEVAARDAEEGERLAAEAYACGAVGLEEREDRLGITLVLYVPEADAERVRLGLRAMAPEAAIGAAVIVPETNWAELWQSSHRPVEISRRLLIRPSFSDARPGAGQRELVIDPGQAFGTGGHASTHLALEWIDAIAENLKPGTWVLDVGTGTGVLALAALALGAERAVALDLDPLATEAALENARRNDCADRLHVFCGPLAACNEPEGSEAGFDLVVANMLRTELLPLVSDIAARVREGGRAIFSGLLASELPGFEAALGGAGLAVIGSRHADDANGERWSALLTSR